tara:strand:- start:8201 stop:8824 length:624 start_codon:yes stop_codon:yes gene_type:complete
MSNIAMLGTDYGGWIVDLDMIPQGSTVISAGVGEDISFDLEIIKRYSCHIIGIDPTPKSHKFIQSQNKLKNFTLLKKALTHKNDDIVKLFKNTNPDHVSESELFKHHAVSQYDYHLAETISLPFLFGKHDNISLIKMDIEGSEYSVIENLKTIPDSVRQICVEFHHFCLDKTLEDTIRCIEHIQSFGFSKIYEKSKYQKLAEVTLIR